MNRVTLVCACASLTLSSACRSQTLTLAEMRKDDPRLEKRITIRCDRLYSGELLEEVAKQIGAPITASPRDRSQDEPLIVFLKEVPAADAMEALQSLVSLKTAPWYWARDGNAGTYSYRLVRPKPAQEIAATIRAEIQHQYESMAEDLIRISEQSPEARKSFLKEWLPNSGLNDPKLLDGYGKDTTMWNGLAALKQGLSKEERLNVYRGKPDTVIPVQSLSPRLRDWVMADWKAARPMTILADGTAVPIPPPAEMHPSTFQKLNGIATPSLIIEMGYGSGAYIGGDPFDKAVKARLAEMWILPGDERQPPKSISGTRIEGAEPNSSPVGLGTRLRQMTSNSGVNLLCRATWMELRQPHDPGSPVGKSLTQYLSELRTESWDKHMSKWRGIILLLSHPTWFLEDEMHPPLAEVKRLREASAADGGFLPLLELFRAAQLPPPQLEWVGMEFNGVRSIGNRTNLLSALAANPLLAAQVQSSRGVAASDLVRRMKDPPTGLVEASARPDARMRIVTSYMPMIGRIHRFEMLIDGAWKRVDEMADAGWKKPAAIETEVGGSR